MLTPLILFLGLTVATAVIAHWSDNLGKKLGKKRVSLFGLRPRTTATILTVASSWGIMLFTLAALLIAVAPLRNALFSYDRERAQAQRDREQAKIEIGAAQKRLVTTQQQVETANTQFNAANSQLKEAQNNLKKADLAVRQAQKAAKAAENEGRKRAAAAKKQADEAVARAAEAQNRLAEAQNRVAQAQNRVTLARKSLALAERRERVARRAESIAQGETRSAKRETERAQKETRTAQQLRQAAAVELQASLVTLKIAQTQFKTTQTNLKTAQNNLKAAQSNLKTTQISLKETQDNLKNASESYERARRGAIDTGAQVVQLERQRIQLENLAEATLSNDAPIKRDQAFAARIIDASQDAQTIATQLRDMLKQAQEAFRKVEDELPEPRFPSGAGVQLLPLPIPDESGNPLILEGEPLLQRLSREIIEEGQPISARLVAPRNFLATETQIELRFVFLPIEPAFSAGEVLASLTIDGSQGDALIFNSLLELTNLGRSRAESLRVNPPESPTQPNFYASDTNVRLFEALRTISNSKARLRVNLVAAKELTTVEPLKVRFEVEGASPATS